MHAFSIVQYKYYSTYKDIILIQVGQLILTLVPLVFIIVYIFGRIVRYCHKKRETEFEMETLPARLLSKTDSEQESKDEESECLEYSLFVESTSYM